MNEESSMTRKSFGLSDAEAEALEESADKYGVSVSRKIRQAVDTQLELEHIQEEGGRIVVVPVGKDPYFYDPTAD
ncbi:MAG: hypothetical protein AAF635_10085 [Cyanobacteria bacterium P01_C01_bin.69]